MTMLVPPDRLEEEENLLARIARGESIARYETIHIRKGGSAVNVSVTVSPIRNRFGKIVGVSKISRDITVLKRAEQEQRIAATAFDSNEAMLITDANSVILRVNRAFTETTGYTSKEIVGKRPNVLKSGHQDPPFYASMWDAIHRAGSWQGEIWDRRKNGEIFPSWMTITAVKGDDGKVSNYVCILSDITSRKAAEEEIRHLAFYDALTDLPNRRLLMERLRHALTTSMRSGREGALMFIDMDNFKTLNDTHGHEKGDLLLQEVARRLALCVRKCDTIARLGGDEFVVLIEELSANLDEAGVQAESVGEKILRILNLPYDLAGLLYQSTPSIGVTLFCDHKQSAGELLKRADLAMYQAKAAGRNVLRFFDSKIEAVVAAHIALEAEFRQGMLQNEFVLYFQVQVDGEGHPTGVEALVRWRHPTRGLVPPLEFIPLAEETGLILNLGHWVLEAACAQLVTWATQPTMAHLTMAVNVSAQQFRRPDYVQLVLAVLDNTGAAANQLNLEITESLLLHDVEDIIFKMATLQARGVSFSLDDFGTGYSSLSYLKRLPLDQLKIDRSFVRDVLTDKTDAAIVRTIVALAQSLGLEVIAEGVETDDQREFLAKHECHAYQGFLYSRALPLVEFEQFMHQRMVIA